MRGILEEGGGGLAAGWLYSWMISGGGGGVSPSRICCIRSFQSVRCGGVGGGGSGGAAADMDCFYQRTIACKNNAWHLKEAEVGAGKRRKSAAGS